MPADRSEEGLIAWEVWIRRFADLPHAFVKISGIGLAGKPWRLEDNRTVVLKTIDSFGPVRSMFASNFPVDGLCGSFKTLIGCFREIVSGFSPEEQAAMFSGVACDFYVLAVDQE